MQPPARLRIQLLGSFAVMVEESLVPDRAWRSQRAVSLIKLLALAPGFRLHREQIMDTLWPDLDPADQGNNLNVAASRARQALVSTGAQPGRFIVRTGDHLTLGPAEAVAVDVLSFEIAADRARLHPHTGALEEALSLYSGDLLPDDPFAEWAQQRRKTLHATVISLLSRLGDAYSQLGQTDRAIETYQQVMRFEPTHETAASALLRLFAKRRQRAQALSLYNHLVRRLRDELDVDPLPETVALADAIRRGEIGPVRDANGTSGTSVQAPDAPPHLLPTHLSALIGRDQEIEQISRLLWSERLITLTGPGGIGKTRLAIAVADQVSDRFQDGVLFIDLSAIREAELVGLVIARALDLRQSGAQDVTYALQSYLSGRRMLLIIDNFEQVADASDLIATLLQQATQLSVLITSRMSLRLSGEYEYPVQPLAIPASPPSNADIEAGSAAAVSLFYDRARRIRPDFQLTAEHAQSIVEICQRVDGLPLGIELAAARVKVLTPSAMLTRLERPLSFLVAAPRNHPERHQTMRRMIAWSHDLLSPPERKLFRRLSVFLGGWTLEAAERVVGPGDDVGIETLDGLASLVDKSLVVQREDAEGIRFGMLETIRNFALEELTSHRELCLMQERHLAWALDFAERASGFFESGSQVIWLDRLDREAANLRAALDWARGQGDVAREARLAVALRMYWFIRGHIPEGIRQLLSIADAPASQNIPGLRAELLNSAAMMCRDGDDALAYRISLESRDISRRAGDAKREADALANLAYIALERGDLENACLVATECLEINQRLGNEQGVADVTSVLALAAAAQGEFHDAKRLHLQSVAIWESLNDLQGIIWGRTRLSTVLVKTGDFTHAFETLESSYRIARDLDFRWGLSWAFDGLARLAVALEAWETAASSARLAASIRSEAGLVLPGAEQAEVDDVWRAINRTTCGHTDRPHPGDESKMPNADQLIASLGRRVGALTNGVTSSEG